MGLEFVDLFDQWAESYDQSVSGNDLEYREVFSHYDDTLQAVANLVDGNIVEFGVGTGNLTQKLVEKSCNVVGFEPSASMREKAKEKLPQVQIEEGDFLHFKTMETINGFVSTYAFHHLTDSEKAEAISLYRKCLTKGGKVVFADTVFESEGHKLQAIKNAKQKGFLNLAKDLETEYYTTIPVLKAIFHKHDFNVLFKQINPFIWLIDATKL